MARFIEAQGIDGFVFHINADCVECIYDRKEGQAVVSLASGQEIGIKMSARDFRNKAKALE
jgi:hypothetical protein